MIPRAEATRVRGRMADGTVKIALKAPPADGRANAELIRFLADEFQTRRSSVRILSGGTSRRKLVSIDSPTSTPAWFAGR